VYNKEENSFVIEHLIDAFYHFWLFKMFIFVTNCFFYILTNLDLQTIYVKQQPTKIYIMKTVSSIVENTSKQSPFTKCVIIGIINLTIIKKYNDRIRK
jgi:hypothetical protein